MALSHYKPQANFAGVTPETLVRVTPSLLKWGVALGAAAFLFVDQVPLVRNQLVKLPVVGTYWHRYDIPEPQEE
ncbi:hypothetical protein K7432_000450 [Basidiobolus ranarum]|uniref:Uncharacterized protein n=1 Tax=Basidiobolus ranarum TaxID=34480 RepID=A0ABR2X4I2_9FUNG